MASVSVFVCPGSAQGIKTVTLSTDQYPSCKSGQGSWQQVELVEPFDPSQLNSEELGAAFGAGFVVLATGLVMAWAARQIVAAIRQ